eukprot:5624135-Amphidinium_carterae.1
MSSSASNWPCFIKPMTAVGVRRPKQPRPVEHIQEHPKSARNRVCHCGAQGRGRQPAAKARAHGEEKPAPTTIATIFIAN